LGSISKNIFGIKPSEEYISDLRDYLLRYNKLRDTRHSPILSWSVLYNKLMRAMAKADPSLDLRTITRDEIYTKNLPCISIKKAVEAGLLPKVLDWQIFTPIRFNKRDRVGEYLPDQAQHSRIAAFRCCLVFSRTACAVASECYDTKDL
jgi:hypothetical protein